MSSSRTVWVGNIPYDASEHQLQSIFEAVGPVVNFRLMTDRETGKPQGFGFCEYRDRETAESAVRNLNGSSVNGRQLRVDYAEREFGQGGGGSGGSSGGSSAGRLPPPSSSSSYGGGMHAGPATAAPGASAAPVQPQSSVEAIAQVVGSLTKAQMIDILTEMKRVIQTNPEAAKQMLAESPQLAQTLLQIQVHFGLVTPADLQHLQVQRAPAAAAPVSNIRMQMPVGGMPPPQQQQGMHAPVGMAPPLGHMPPQMAPVPPAMAAPAPMVMPVPPAASSQLPPDLERILRLTPQEIAQLPIPSADREKLLLLHQQYSRHQQQS